MKRLDDVAREAGVSPSTVSRALAGNPVVNPETAERIRKLAEKVGYNKNRFAQNLARQESRVVGMVVPDVHNPYFPQLIETTAKLAKERGYVLVPTFSDYDQSDEQAGLRLLGEMRAEAVIIVTGRAGLPGLETAQSLRAAGTEVVVLGWAEGSETLDNVYGDDPAGMADITRRLIGLGHHRIVLVADSVERGPMDRTRGFVATMSEHGLWSEKSLVTWPGVEDQAPALVDALCSSPDRPTAIIGYHDVLATRLIGALQDRGFRVPQDMSVVGLDNLAVGELIRPRLTTVDFDITNHAASALRILFGRLGGEETSALPIKVIVTPRVVIRDSSSTPPLAGR
jgi:LacI family transcriptional regulator